MSRKGAILIIDDEKEIRESLEQLLALEGHQAVTAATAEEGLKKFEEQVFDLALVDISLPDQGGLEVLKTLKRENPEVGVIMITAFDSSQAAFQASKDGAESYVTKPWDNDKLLLEIRTGAGCNWKTFSSAARSSATACRTSSARAAKCSGYST